MPRACLGERVGELQRNLADGVRVEGTRRDALRQRAAVHELHHDEQLVVYPSDLVNRADARMGERRCRARFLQERSRRSDCSANSGRRNLIATGRPRSLSSAW